MIIKRKLLIILLVLFTPILLAFILLLVKYVNIKDSYNDLRERTNNRKIELGKEYKLLGNKSFILYDIKLTNPKLPIGDYSIESFDKLKWIVVALDVEIKTKDKDSMKNTLLEIDDEMKLTAFSKDPNCDLDCVEKADVVWNKDISYKPDLISEKYNLLSRKDEDYPTHIRGWITFVLKNQKFPRKDGDNTFMTLLTYESLGMVPIRDLPEEMKLPLFKNKESGNNKKIYFDAIDQVISYQLVKDVTGDGKPETIYVTIDKGCGSCHQKYIYVTQADKTLIELSGDDSQIDALPSGNGITIKEPVRKDDEPLCCPSEYKTDTYIWDGSSFIKQK